MLKIPGISFEVSLGSAGRFCHVLSSPSSLPQPHPPGGSSAAASGVAGCLCPEHRGSNDSCSTLLSLTLLSACPVRSSSRWTLASEVVPGGDPRFAGVGGDGRLGFTPFLARLLGTVTAPSLPSSPVPATPKVSITDPLVRIVRARSWSGQGQRREDNVGAGAMSCRCCLDTHWVYKGQPAEFSRPPQRSCRAGVVWCGVVWMARGRDLDFRTTFPRHPRAKASTSNLGESRDFDYVSRRVDARDMVSPCV